MALSGTRRGTCDRGTRERPPPGLHPVARPAPAPPVPAPRRRGGGADQPPPRRRLPRRIVRAVGLSSGPGIVATGRGGRAPRARAPPAPPRRRGAPTRTPPPAP